MYIRLVIDIYGMYTYVCTLYFPKNKGFEKFQLAAKSHICYYWKPSTDTSFQGQ